MKKHNRFVKATMALLMVMLTIGLTSPVVVAEEAEEATGTATVTNADPSVTSVAITDMDDVAASALDPDAYYKVKVTVSDANTLEDIVTIDMKMFLTSVGEEGTDDEVNHYTFKYTAGTPTWEEIGPDSETDSHIDPAGCVEASPLTSASGTYIFKVKLAKVAESTTGLLWTAWAVASDEGPSASETTTFDVNEFIELAIDTPTLTFSGAPGATDLPSSPVKTICTVTSNDPFDIQVMLSADWLGTTHAETIPAESTYADKDGGVSPYDVTLNDESYQDIWPDEIAGKDITRDIFWFLDLPTPLRDDTYTTTFKVQAVKAT